MSLLAQTIEAIRTPDPTVAPATQALLDAKTKPRGSLGRIEELACRLAAARGAVVPEPPVKAIVVMAADHGVCAEGVSAYPQAVTGQMVLNFARGGAAINVLARAANAEVLVVDMGVLEQPALDAGVVSVRVGPGTRNLAAGPAMTPEETRRALEAGITIAGQLADRGVSLIGTGEMGIGNTTSASALTAAFTGVAPERVTGRGTGVDDATYQRKVAVIRRALAVNEVATTNPLGTLANLGGFEIAGLAGLVLGAAARKIPVLLDGFISTAGGLAAARLAPACQPYLLASHRSVEPGHTIQLDALGLRPLLELELRLGEGTGAALAMSLADAAIRVLHEMATFQSAAVSDTGA